MWLFMMIISMVMMFSGVWVYVMKHKHLLIMLLSLEIMMLGLYFLLGQWGFSSGEDFFMLIFLVFAACEGSLGLGVLVSLVRSHGNDKFNVFKSLEC